MERNKLIHQEVNKMAKAITAEVMNSTEIPQMLKILSAPLLDRNEISEDASIKIYNGMKIFIESIDGEPIDGESCSENDNLNNDIVSGNGQLGEVGGVTE